MQTNSDPKPGRWILPLVIVAMIGFTYVFTSSIDPSLPSGTSTDATTAESPDGSTGEGEAPVITADPAGEVAATDPEVAAYLQQLQTFATELDAAGTKLVDANSGWDARTIKYGETKTAFQEATAALDTWANAVSASLAPAAAGDLQIPHQDIIAATAIPVKEAKKALDGLVNSESTVPRTDAIKAFQAAQAEFKAKVAAAVTAAGA